MAPMFGIARSMMNLGVLVMYWIGSLQLAGPPLERPGAANSNGQHHLDKTLLSAAMPTRTRESRPEAFVHVRFEAAKSAD
ncbi:MAG: hypothetical protein ABI702_11115 [Burkholderiales bacterium]